MVSFNDLVVYLVCIIGIFTYIVFLLTLFSPNKKKYEKDSSYRPKVSILVPVWNEAREEGIGIRRTLDSLIGCDYPKEKLEIIVVNDGSTDASLDIIKEYKKHGIKIFSHKKPKGKTKALNTGFKHSSGELIASLDADTIIMPDVLDKLVPCFKDKDVMGAKNTVSGVPQRGFYQTCAI